MKIMLLGGRSNQIRVVFRVEKKGIVSLSFTATHL